MTPYDHLGFMPPFLHPLGFLFLPLFMVLALWTIVIKGFALWHAARGDQKWWFVALLILNTLGILEIVYLIWFRADHAVKNESVVTPIGTTTTVTTETTTTDSAE